MSPHEFRRRGQRRRRKNHPIADAAGFTLIELLLVIAVIAILAALFLPVFSSVQAKSNQIKCASNMKQLVAGILSYAADNQLYLPPTSASSPSPEPWDESIAKYINTPVVTALKVVQPILICPSDTRPRVSPNFPRSYSVSGIAVGTTRGLFAATNAPVSRQLANIPSTANKIMLFEDYTGTTSSGTAGKPVANYQYETSYDWAAGFLSASSIPVTATGAYYHIGKMNFGFADGHVEALNPTVVYNPNKILW